MIFQPPVLLALSKIIGQIQKDPSSFFEEIIFLFLKKVKKEKRISRRTTFTCYYRYIQRIRQ